MTLRRRFAAIAALVLFALPSLSKAQDYRIVFVSKRNRENGLYVMRADGSNVQRLTDDKLAVLMDGAWSPDGRRLAFCALREAGMRLGPRGVVWNDRGDEDLLSKYDLPFHFPLYVMDADGEHQKRVLDVPVVPGVRWSPDGTRILFASAYEDPNRRRPVSGALYVLDLSTHRHRRITPVGAVPLISPPAWSPDGAAVVFTCGKPPHPGEICVVGADGTHQRQLTRRSAVAVMPAWSPDGTRIAFVAAPRGPSDPEAGVYVMDTEGENQRRVSKLRASRVSWSPDGKRLLIRAATGAGYVVDLERNVAVKLSFGSGRVLDEVFAPDGRSVIYRSSEQGKSKIYAIGIEGSDRRRLSDDAGDDSMFAVSGMR